MYLVYECECECMCAPCWQVYPEKERIFMLSIFTILTAERRIYKCYLIGPQRVVCLIYVECGPCAGAGLMHSATAVVRKYIHVCTVE